MSDLERLAALNHVDQARVEEALRQDIRCMVLREVCEYMKRSPENALRIRRLPISDEERRSLLNKQAGKCAVCNKKLNMDDFHVDHIVPWDYVGDELENNKRVLCAACNWKKSSQAVTALYDLFFGTRGEAI